jgi:hypothetical protein
MDYTDFSRFLKRRTVGYTFGMEHAPTPRNLLSHYEETRAAMGRVEQGGWLKGNERIEEHWDEASEGDRSTSLKGAVEWLKTVNRNIDTWHVVYGDGGMNRWYVHADGRVRFSKFHATSEGLKRAEQEGFWIE